MSELVLSIDVGTTATAAALQQDGVRRVLELDRHSSMPSTVLAAPGGELVVGEAAEAQAPMYPDRVERTPKRRLGDPVLLLGERAVEPVDALAAIIAHVAAQAAGQCGGAMPDRLVLTHPARWGRRRLDLLQEAARRCGLPQPELVAEPVAAAAHLADDLTSPGDVLAVYDLGGGTLDIALVRRTEAGFDVAGPPGGDENLGGEAFDDLVVSALHARLSELQLSGLAVSEDRTWQSARLNLRRSARVAKEALSSSSIYRWYEGPPLDVELQLTNDELQGLLRSSVEKSVASLVDTVRRAGIATGDLRSVVMVGGGARIPLVGRLLAETLGRPPATWGDPKAAVCLGALLAGGVAPEMVASVGAPESAPPPPAAVSLDEPGAGGQPAGRAVGVDPPESPVDPVDPVDETPLSADAEHAPPSAGAASPPIEELIAGPGLEPLAPMRPIDPRGATEGESRRAWTGSRIGATVAVGLVALGVVSGILAFLLR